VRWIILVCVSCVAHVPEASSTWHATAATGCQIVPVAHAPAKFRHRGNRAAHRLGEPRHRGLDLVTSESAPSQRIEGDIGYMAVTKELEDEDVEMFACVQDHWRSLGLVRSDRDGHVAVELTGAARLPAGLHPLYMAVAGDGRGVNFLAYVAPPNAPVFVTDIDGTLTTTENGVVRAALFKSDLDDQPGAPAALRTLAQTMQPIYLTARSHSYIALTRRWLDLHGYPRGPLLTANHFTRPGVGAQHHKRHVLDGLAELGIVPAFGIGNRASDVHAYANLPRAFVKVPGYAEELEPFIASGLATEFSSYAELPALVTAAGAATSSAPAAPPANHPSSTSPSP
jgi:hypothetical protein